MRTLLTLSLIFLLCTLTVLANSNLNNYQVSISYDTVYVKPGDTVWNIAAKQVTDNEDIRDIIAVIKKVNGLDNNAHLYPGQALKVPVNRGK